MQRRLIIFRSKAWNFEQYLSKIVRRTLLSFENRNYRTKTWKIIEIMNKKIIFRFIPATQTWVSWHFFFSNFITWVNKFSDKNKMNRKFDNFRSIYIIYERNWRFTVIMDNLIINEIHMSVLCWTNKYAYTRESIEQWRKDYFLLLFPLYILDRHKNYSSKYFIVIIIMIICVELRVERLIFRYRGKLFVLSRSRSFCYSHDSRCFKYFIALDFNLFSFSCCGEASHKLPRKLHALSSCSYFYHVYCVTQRKEKSFSVSLALALSASVIHFFMGNEMKENKNWMSLRWQYYLCIIEHRLSSYFCLRLFISIFKTPFKSANAGETRWIIFPLFFQFIVLELENIFFQSLALQICLLSTNGLRRCSRDDDTIIE